jgi:teichuronic acid exporter
MVLLWLIARWVPREHFSWTSFKNLFSYGSKLLGSGLLNTLYANIYPLIIGKFYTPSSLGLYSRAQAFANLPSSNATGILQRVTFPVLSTIQNQDERLKINYRKILRMSAFVIFPVMTLMAAVAAPLVEVLISSKWNGCVIYLQIICFAMMWFPIHAINLNLLQVRGRTDLFLKLEIIKKIIGVLILVITLKFGLIVMCWGQVVVSVISLVINTYYTGKLIDLGFIKQMKDIIPIFLISVITFFFAYFIMQFVNADITKLFVGLLSGIIFYLLCSYIRKSEELFTLFNIIKRK